MKKWFAPAALLLGAAVLLINFAGAQERFNHQQHARLFPLCTSCHEGVETGAQADMFPAPESCAQCHDGQVERTIDWRGPTRVASNLKFDHDEHFVETDSKDCGSCHRKAPTAPRMTVVRAQAETCIACHQKDEPDAGPVQHFAATNDCAQCHLPLRDAPLSNAQLAALPTPPSHENAEFLRTHARSELSAASTCATCHTRESCSRCHANAQDVKLIAALGSNERVAGIVAGKKAIYPIPADHGRADFTESHGVLAQGSVQSCSNCHTRESCQQCHSGGRVGADQIAALPVRNVAPGVALRARRSVHPANSAEAHGTSAGAHGESCTSCHAEKFCSDCHQGADSRKFHPANFSARHAQAVYTGESECASCHSRETFCQSCHNGLGMTTNGQRSSEFHNGQALWLLQHGQPARQNLESCTSCHTQSSCARCHSAKAGWGVSPHGSGIPGGKLADKNRPTCLRCHYSR